MNNVQEMLMGCRGRNVVGVAIAAAAIVLQACARTHGPQDSTETGNPPVIDAERVTLMVEHDEVHVVGDKGAVTPGGVTITVRNLVSGKSANSDAAKDGSFDVKAPGSVNDGFRLQASNGVAESKPVFVTQTSAVQGDGKSGALSCEQQTMLSDVQTRAASMTAETTCTQDEDCVEVQTSTVCWDTCEEIAVSKTGKMQVDDFVSSINAGLCSGYEAAGCMTGRRHCPADPLPHPLACVQGQCKRADGGADAGDDAGLSTCESKRSRAMDELQRATADADRTCSSDDECVFAPSTSDCFGGCSLDVVSTTGQMQVQAAVDALNSGLCANFSPNCDQMGHSCPAPSVPRPSCNQGRCTGKSCSDRVNDSSALLVEAIAKADNSCSTDADCVFAPAPSECFAGCRDVAVSKTGQAAVQDALTSVCAEAVAAPGCSVLTNDCGHRTTPTCKQGHCAPALDCQDRSSSAYARLAQVAYDADRSCTQDADCEFAAYTSQCGTECFGAILSAKGRADLDAAITEVNASICASFEADGCMPDTSGCASTPTPVCERGHCTSKPAP
jgi:hypothetical protein